MASDLLNSKTDEVARNGAYWKILRPEVFPGAPLQSAKQSSAPFGSLAVLPRRCHMSYWQGTGGVPPLASSRFKSSPREC